MGPRFSYFREPHLHFRISLVRYLLFYLVIGRRVIMWLSRKVEVSSDAFVLSSRPSQLLWMSNEEVHRRSNWAIYPSKKKFEFNWRFMRRSNYYAQNGRGSEVEQILNAKPISFLARACPKLQHVLICRPKSTQVRNSCVSFPCGHISLLNHYRMCSAGTNVCHFTSQCHTFFFVI